MDSKIPKFIQRAVDQQMYPAVIVANEKHGCRYLKAGTKEELLASCLKLLTIRHNEGYWYYKPEAPTKKPSVPLEQALALPDGALKNMALQEHKQCKLDLAYYEEELKQYAIIEEAIRTKDGYLAFQALSHRRDYEYEGFEVRELE